MSAITVTTRPDGVAVLTFDQPGSKANVLSRELWAEFGDSLAGLAARADLKGLVLASAKPGIFIAGADLKLLVDAPGPNDPEVRAFIGQGHRVLFQLEDLPYPTCAAIDGAALGGGLEVALACDYRVCGTNPKVQLGLPEVKLGLIPGWGGTQRLLHVTSDEHAVAMLTTGQSDDAEQALAHTLVSKQVDSARLLDAAAGVVLEAKEFPSLREKRKGYLLDVGVEKNQLAGTGAAAEALRVMFEGASLPLAESVKLETEAFLRLAGSDESKRLIAEFFSRKK